MQRRRVVGGVHPAGAAPRVAREIPDRRAFHRSRRSAARRGLLASVPAPPTARRWRAADGGPVRQRTAAEESPRSGRHGVGREPDGRESEPRSRNDTARWDGDGAAPEAPPGSGETADSPGASPDRREEESPRPSRRARSRMLPETERGLLPRPGRSGGRPPGRYPPDTLYRETAGRLKHEEGVGRDPIVRPGARRRAPVDVLRPVLVRARDVVEAAVRRPPPTR